MLRLAVRAVFATEAADLSLLHFLFYSHAGGLLDRLLNVAGGAQESRVVGGSQVLATGLAAQLGDVVHLSCPVRRIVQDNARVTVHADGLTVDAGAIVVTIPPTLAGRIDYEPALPSWRDQLTQRMPMGSVIKSMAVYDEAFWRDDGLTGQVTSDVGPVQLTFDNSPPGGTPGVLLSFVEGVHARELSRAARSTSGGPRRWTASPSTSAPRRGAVGVPRARLVGRALERRLLRRAPATGCPHPVRSRAAAPRAGGSTGRAPRPRRCGPATWTARSARARPWRSTLTASPAAAG